jgi:cell wall assembly regulator SMI1
MLNNDLENILTQLDLLWEKMRPKFYQNLAKGVTKAQIQDAELKLGFELPNDFKTLYFWHNGEGDQRDGISESGRFSPYWFVSPDICGFLSLENVVRDYLSYKDGYEEKPFPFWRHGWIPFLAYSPGGDYIAYDLGVNSASKSGRLVVLDHETPEFNYAAYPSLFYLFNGILKATQQGFYIYTDGGITLSEEFDASDCTPIELMPSAEEDFPDWTRDI